MQKIATYNRRDINVPTIQSPKNPIFIVGHSRSGSTLLATALGRHSEIMALPETHFFGASYSGFFLKRLFSYLAPNMVLKFALDGNIRLGDVKFSRANIVEKIVNSSRVRIKHVFDAICADTLRFSGKPRILEKTPYHIEHVERILRWYPDAKIISIIRDGRDALDSLMAASWTHSNAQRHAAYWSWCVNRSLRLEHRHPKSVRIVRYEDLLRQPQATLDALCEFVGVPYESALLNPNRDAGTVPNWEKGWKAKSTKKIDPNEAFKWKSATQPMHLVWTYWMNRQLQALKYETCQSVKSPMKFRYQRLPFLFTYSIWRQYRTHFCARRNKFRPTK